MPPPRSSIPTPCPFSSLPISPCLRCTGTPNRHNSRQPTRVLPAQPLVLPSLYAPKGRPFRDILASYWLRLSVSHQNRSLVEKPKPRLGRRKVKSHCECGSDWRRGASWDRGGPDSQLGRLGLGPVCTWTVKPEIGAAGPAEGPRRCERAVWLGCITDASLFHLLIPEILTILMCQVLL